MSESIYLGHVSTSTDNIIRGSVKDIKIGLTPINKRQLVKIIREKKSNKRFKKKKQIANLQ